MFYLWIVARYKTVLVERPVLRLRQAVHKIFGRRADRNIKSLLAEMPRAERREGVADPDPLIVWKDDETGNPLQVDDPVRRVDDRAKRDGLVVEKSLETLGALGDLGGQIMISPIRSPTVDPAPADFDPEFRPGGVDGKKSLLMSSVEKIQSESSHARMSR